MVKENSKLFLLVLLGMLTAFGPFVTDMYLPSLPAMGEYFNTTSSMVQLGLTTSMIGLAVGQLFFGPLSDRYGRRLPLLVAMWLFIGSTLCCLFSQSIGQFVAFRLVQGIAGAGGIVISRSIATDKYSGHELAKMLAVIGAINGVAPVAAPIVGGVFTESIGWQGIFCILLVLGIILLLSSYRFHESLPREQRITSGWGETFRSFGTVLKDRSYVCYVLQMGFAQGVLFAYIASSPFIVQQHYGFSPLAFSLCFAVNAVAIGVSAALSVKFKRPAGSLRRPATGIAGHDGAYIYLDHRTGHGMPAAQCRYGLRLAGCHVFRLRGSCIAAGRPGRYSGLDRHHLRGMCLLFDAMHADSPGQTKNQGLLCLQHIPKALRQVDVFHPDGIGKEGGNLCRRKAGNTATHFRHQEGEFGMPAGKVDKLVHIGADGLGTAVHGGNAVSLSLQTYTLPPHGTPLAPGQQRGTTSVMTSEVAAENKDFTGTKLGNAV